MDFKELLRLARHRWKTIATFFVLGILAAAVYSFMATPIYHSTSRVFISTDVSNSAEAYYASSFGTARVQSYADLATSRDLMRKVIDRANLNLAPGQLASKVSATVVSGTVIIDIDVRDPSARTAQRIAQAEAEELTGYLAQIETPAGKTSTPVKATIVDPASFDGHPVSPRTGLNLAVATILGLLIGCAVAVSRDLLDTTVKSKEDVESVTETPVMADVAFDPAVTKSPLLTDAGTPGGRSEAFRLLRTNLQFLDLDDSPKAFVISSAVPAEGKTTTATNLAIALSQAGQRVLLVDGDLRRPGIASLLGLESAVGLTTVLVGRSDLQASIQRHAASGIHVLTSGPIPPNPTEILQSRATKRLIGELREQYDAVIVDAPPLLPVADAAIMATDADGAIVVVHHGKTTKEQLREATTRLAQVNARLFGVTMNMAPRRRSNHYQYGYGYGFGYEPGTAKG
ncbi:MAG: polysaccharide biosynthesis tyrosine autokinase [Marmoricola sp.]